MTRLFLAALMFAPTTALAQSSFCTDEAPMDDFVPAQSDDWTLKTKIIDYHDSRSNGGNINLIAGMTVVPARVIAVPHGELLAIEITTPTEIWDFEVWNPGCPAFAGVAPFAFDEEAHVAWLFFMDDTDGKESIFGHPQGYYKVTYDTASKCLMGEAPPDAE